MPIPSNLWTYKTIYVKRCTIRRTISLIFWFKWRKKKLLSHYYLLLELPIKEMKILGIIFTVHNSSKRQYSSTRLVRKWPTKKPALRNLRQFRFSRKQFTVGPNSCCSHIELLHLDFLQIWRIFSHNSVIYFHRRTGVA